MGVEPSPELATEAPRCAAHAEEASTGTCERCGDFVCARCLDPESATPERCRACRERVGADLMAWEHPEGSWASRYWLTTKDLVARPTDTLERVQPGSIGMAFLYASVHGAVQGLVFGLLFGAVLAALFASFGSELEVPPELATGEAYGMLLGLLVGGVLGAPLFGSAFVAGQAIVRGLLFHLGVVLGRGDGGVGASLYAASYVSAIYVLSVPAALAFAVPLIGPVLFALIVLALEIWQAVHLTTAARRFHHLEGGRAALAGWAPFLGIVGTSALCCAGYLAILASVLGSLG